MGNLVICNEMVKSTHTNTAGIDPLEAKLSSYLYKGDNSYAMRLVANGRFVMMEACRSLDEYYLVNALLNPFLRIKAFCFKRARR